MTLKDIQKIIKDFETSPLMSLELEMSDFKLRLSKNKMECLNDPKTNIERDKLNPYEQNANEKTFGNEVKSALVGTYYASPAINGDPYVKVGDRVRKDQVLCIIEAMKIMNEIASPYDGIVKEIKVNNGEVVGYDQVIMVIE